MSRFIIQTGAASIDSNGVIRKRVAVLEVGDAWRRGCRTNAGVIRVVSSWERPFYEDEDTGAFARACAEATSLAGMLNDPAGYVAYMARQRAESICAACGRRTGYLEHLCEGA